MIVQPRSEGGRNQSPKDEKGRHSRPGEITRKALIRSILGAEMPTNVAGPKREEGERTNSNREVGRGPVATGLVIQEGAWHIVSIQLMNYGSIKGNLRSSRLLLK